MAMLALLVSLAASFFPFQQFQQFDNSPMGRVEQLMAFHQYWDAYKALEDMINRERNAIPSKYYRLKATCAMHMAMPKECIDDCTKILSGKNVKATSEDKRSAVQMRANAYMMIGDVKSAEEDALQINDRALARKAQDIGRYIKQADSKIEKGQIGEAISMIDAILKECPRFDRFIIVRADLAWEQQDYTKYKELAKIIDESGDYVVYRKGILAFCDGDLKQALSSLRRASKTRPGSKNASAAVKLVTIANNAVTNAQKAIDENRISEADELIEKLVSSYNGICPDNSVIAQHSQLLRVKTLVASKKTEDAMELLNNLVTKFPDSIDFVIERGNIHLENGDYDSAIFDFTSAQRRNPSDQRVQSGLNKAQQLKKEATHIDYYKILGVPKTASSTEIASAFKKSVREWHPDRFSDPVKKAEAEKKMKTINVAYEILSDSNKKRLYDAGVDPEDPNSNANFNNFDPFAAFFGQNAGFEFQQGNGFRFAQGPGFHFEFHF